MAGTDSFVQVAIDGAGKKIRNFLNTIGANDVYQQVVTLGKSDGTVIDDPSRSSVTQPVSGAFFQVTQPVSATVLPLPTGAATDASLGTIAADIALQAKLTDTQPVSGAFFQATQPVSLAASVAVTGAFFQATQPVSAAALPLPTGASTEATLALIKAKTDNLDVALSTRTKPADTQSVSNAGLTNLDVALSTRTKPADQQHVIVDTMTPALALDASVNGLLKPASTLAAVTAITSALPAGTNVIGHVIVDSGANIIGKVELDDGSGTSVTVGQKVMASSLPVVVASDQSAMPENLTQIGGAAIAIKALPTGGLGQAAIPVYTNAIQLLTYTYGVRGLATGVLVANTAKAILSIEHSAASTKTVRIRRILIAGRQTTLLAGDLDIEITTGTAASSAGTAITAGKRNLGDGAAECVVKSLPTIVAATVQDILPFASDPSAAVSAQAVSVIYDWQEAGETKPWTLRAGVLETFVLNAIADAAQNWTLTIHVTLTEE